MTITSGNLIADSESAKRSYTGAEFVADVIAAWQIDHVFFMDAILRETLVELEKRGVKRILAHSEMAAAYMADGYSRASGKPGICMAQSVGAANLAAGLQDAFLNRTPVIAITGRKNSIFQWRNAYQELPHGPMYTSVTKFNADVAVIEQLPYLLNQAFREALSGTKRPVHLDFDGYRGAEIESANFEMSEKTYDDFIRPRRFAVAASSRAELENVVQLIEQASRPMLVLGVGADQPEISEAVCYFAEKLSIPVATSVGGRGLMPTAHPNHFGVVGNYSAPYANHVLYEADLVVYVGCHVGDQISCDWSVPSIDTPIVQIDVDAAELGRNYPNTLGLAGEPATVLRQLADLSSVTRDRSGWIARCSSAREQWLQHMSHLTASGAKPIRSERLVDALSKNLPSDALVVADTGFSATWAAQLLEFPLATQKFLRAAGTLGWALPAAIGAKFACPERQVVCFTGDGAINYHLAELETIRRWNVPLVIVVNNNSSLGQGRRSVKKLYEGKQGKFDDLVTFERLDFAKLAEVFQIRALRVEEPSEMDGALKTAFRLNEPVLIDVVTDPDCNPEPPWLPKAK